MHTEKNVLPFGSLYEQIKLICKLSIVGYIATYCVPQYKATSTATFAFDPHLWIEICDLSTANLYL